jgi:signal transduction histidine kinase
MYAEGGGHERYPDHGAWAEMLAELHDKNTRLAALLSKCWPPRSGTAILSELERERSRIARELHAGAGQPLAGIKLHLEILDKCTSAIQEAEGGDAARQTIGRLQTLAEQALSQVRAISHRLHPPEWQEMPLNLALEDLAESSGLAGSLNFSLDLRPLPVEPSHGVKVQMYRCAQECISNITRHSGATEASISLAPYDGQIVLTVRDNGHGFDTSAKNAGIGLRAIVENAASMGGSSRIESSTDGTIIIVGLPATVD